MNVVEDDIDADSLLCIQVVRKSKKLLNSIRAQVGDSHKLTMFQVHTGASCNILNYADYVDLGKPRLDKTQVKLRQFDGTTTRALGGLSVEVAEKNLYFLVQTTRNHSLLSLDASL